MPSFVTASAPSAIESTRGEETTTGNGQTAFPPLLTANAIAGSTVLIAGYSHLTAPRIAVLKKHGANIISVFPERESEDSEVLSRRFEEEGVRWIRREVTREDLVELGREETERVVEAVYVTAEGSERDRIGIYAPPSQIPAQLLTLTSCDPHLHLPPSPHPLQHLRHPSLPLHLYHPLHPLHRPPLHRHHDLRPRLQARLPHPSRNRRDAPAESWGDMCAARGVPEEDSRGG